jgi:hypothetical protein
MGYLGVDGAVLTYEESKKVSKKIKEYGIQQFINIYIKF